MRENHELFCSRQPQEMSFSSNTVSESPEDDESDESQVRFLSSQPLDHEVTPAGDVWPLPSLPLPLRLLYGLNGVTLALPVTALMYIVNTRAEIPVAYLSAYGAVAFLPFSLKPFYAYLTDYHVTTKHLLNILLLASCLTAAGTALIPRNGIVWCFLLAFLRGLTSAWAEFLLGLGLIRHAQDTSSYEQAASLFQSQAATARNIGSLLANVVAFLLFAHKHYSHSPSHDEEVIELDDVMVTILLVATAILNACGALIAYIYPPSDCSKMTDRIRVRQNEHGDAEINQQRVERGYCAAADDSSAMFSNVKSGQCQSLVLFQLVIILLAMRGPMVGILSVTGWRVFFSILAIGLLWSVATIPIPWKRAYRVGSFLILRHSVPKATYLVDSYVYSLFQSTPMILQLMSVCSMGVTVVSAWSYGRILARFSDGRRLMMVIVGTTIIASLLSLCSLTLLFINSVTTMSVWTLLAVNAVVSFSSEWRFLPDVILATTTVGSFNANENVLINDDHSATSDISARDTSGIEYGTLISCIDFGGQIGSWITVPLISALGISRENHWQNLDVMVVATALCGLASAGLVCLLRDRGGEIH